MAKYKWWIVGAVLALFAFIIWRFKLPQILIARLESFRATAYPDGEGMSIGYGHQIQPTESRLRTAVLTKTEASALLAADIEKRYAPAVDAAIAGLGFTVAQRAALISFHYNTGAINKIAPVLRTKNKAAIAAKMKEYRIYKGQVNAGLVARRAEEARAFA